MKEQISINNVMSFSDKYNKESFNKIIENAVLKNGIQNTCLNMEAINKNIKPVFNIELPDSKRYDQKGNAKCWIYSGLNMIKHNMANNLNIDIMNFQLSANYISFFDKLEKSNSVYERIINIKDYSFENIQNEHIRGNLVNEGGYFSFFVNIVEKYGLVPFDIMPNSYESNQYELITTLFAEKVKKDIIKLINLRDKDATKIMLRKEKEKLLYENYDFLSKILGEPKQKFDFEYIDKDKKIVSLKNITPLEFKERFLSINLNDFVNVGNLPMYNKKYNEKYTKKYVENIYNHGIHYILNLEIENIKRMVVRQLKDGIPVVFRAHVRKCKEFHDGILDLTIYNYSDIFHFEQLNKEESLNLYDIKAHHCMTFTGVHIENNQIKRWKVENSYGTTDQKNDGYYIMSDEFFDKFVLEVSIDKKYLNEEEIKLLDNKPTIVISEDPFC